MSLISKPWRGTANLVISGLLGLGLIAALVWYGLGRLDRDDPTLDLQPEAQVVGVKAGFTLKAGDRTSGLREVRVTITQDALEKVLLERTFPPGGEGGSEVDLPFTVEPKSLGLKEGKALIKVRARDRSWGNWFQGRTATLDRGVEIDLVPLNLAFLSVSHLLHSGGTGTILYRLNKAAKESGVEVGGHFYQGYPNPKVAKGEYLVLFPVPRESAGADRVELVARPPVGDEVKQTVTLKVKPRKWRQDKLNLSDAFLQKVASTLPAGHPGDPLGNYLEVNREMRKTNHEKIRQVCSHSAPTPMWTGAFQRYLGKPMARFGDKRTYIYQDKAVDQQVHLGEDLANLEHTPVPAANNGVVVLAQPLGIYGNTVIVDHGLGVFSQYSHLSQIDVKAGDKVEKGTVLGRTGATGLAGGDHLHFSMLLQGEFVDPLEWWDPHWLKDQVEKQMAAGAASAEGSQAAVKPAKAGKGKGKSGRGKKRR